MEESSGSSPIPTLLLVAALIGGGIFFAKSYRVKGLDQLSIESKTPDAGGDPTVFDDVPEGTFVGTTPEFGSSFRADRPTVTAQPSSFVAKSEAPVSDGRRFRNLRVGSWALSGFGASKFGDDAARQNLVRIIRQFDAIALQQIQATERDLVPRIVDAVNEGGRRYDFAIGTPGENGEQLAILFNIDRLHLDRSQTYTVSDPTNQMTSDPMVAWFRAAQPPQDLAWTFSLVNVRINLARAPVEVDLLTDVFHSVRNDGRGEDDVVMAGLFQADDSYLVRRAMGDSITPAVRSVPTDIFGRHQTSNVLMDVSRTSEYLGRGGPVDFLRLYNLSISEAETISSHLPVFAEFTATEGGAM